jgi:hypothetical protein
VRGKVRTRVIQELGEVAALPQGRRNGAAGRENGRKGRWGVEDEFGT